MICSEKMQNALAHSASCLHGFLIFPLGGHPTPNVPFPFVFVQDLSNLQVKCVIALPEPFRQGFVDRRFGNAEMFCRGSDSCSGLDHVHSQFTGALFWIYCHRLPSDAVLLKNPMHGPAEICSLDSGEKTG